MTGKFIRLLLVIGSVLALAYALVLFLLAMDSFESDTIALRDILGFGIHSVPSLIVMILALVGWKTPLWGCLGFFAVAVGFLLFFGGGNDTISFTMITGIPLVLAIIYAVVWFASRKNMKEL
jgi:hypothetical protein